MTTRDLTASMSSAIVAATVRPVIFVEAAFYASGSPDEQLLRLWSGIGSFSWDSKTWTGAGNLLSLSPLEETRRINAVGFSVGLSGLPQSVLALALDSSRQGRAGRVWLGLMENNALVTDPYLIQSGRLDYIDIQAAGDTTEITGQYESRLVDLQRSRERRYTDEQQRYEYPTDTGMRFVAALQDKQLIWGGPGAAASPLAAPTPDPAPVSGGAWYGSQDEFAAPFHEEGDPSHLVNPEYGDSD